MRMHQGFCGLLICLMAACLSSADALGKEPVRLRVLCYNIHHGQGVDGKLDLKRIARVINKARPDLVALQEVDRVVPRSGRVDQAAELARMTKMKFAFGKNLALQGGGYGNAILSRFPILASENRPLPNLDGGEQRGVLIAEMDVPPGSDRLVFLATHFDHRRPDKERQQSAKAISGFLKQLSGQGFLLAGDLNDVIGSATLQQIDRNWTRVNRDPMATIPVGEPKRQIDFIAHGSVGKWSVESVEVMGEKVASDHRPLLAVLLWTPSESVD